MADLTLFHTADVHTATFDGLLPTVAPNANIAHVVRPEWLAHARQFGVDDALRHEISSEVEATSGPTLCSCTTLGPLAETLGMTRIDRPMMTAAAKSAKTHGGPIALAYCLTSTAEASMKLLRECAPDIAATPLFLGGAWPLFETGDFEGFARMLGEDINVFANANPDVKTVVLAQASMMSAADHVTADITVLSSPETALRAALGLRA